MTVNAPAGGGGAGLDWQQNLPCFTVSQFTIWNFKTTCTFTKDLGNSPINFFQTESPSTSQVIVNSLWQPLCCD